MLSLRHVHKVYRMGEVHVPVLQDVNLEIPDGDLMVVVGPSGSGKSTLLNIVGGIDRPTEGEVWFDEWNLTGFDDRRLTLYRREQVGFVFQFYNLVPSLTAVENVQVTTEISADPMDPVQALELVDLQDRLDHFPAQLSGGEQQRVAIARALAKNPRMLLCDEPTGALDLETGRRVLDVLARLNDELGKTVLVITHNSAIAEMAKTVVRLGSGTIADVHANPHRVAPAEVTW